MPCPINIEERTITVSESDDILITLIFSTDNLSIYIERYICTLLKLTNKNTINPNY